MATPHANRTAKRDRSAAADSTSARALRMVDLASADRPRVLRALSRCRQVAADAEATYGAAADAVRDARLRVLLLDQSRRRGRLADELEELIVALQALVSERSFAVPHRSRAVGARGALSRKRGRALLTACERADLSGLEVYDAVREELAELDAPDALLRVLTRQREVLRAGHDGIAGLLHFGVLAREPRAP